jgi:bacteriorhodopsin
MTDRFSYYALGIQALISIIALVLCFWLIATPTEANVNGTSFNIIVFIVGVWLGRGADYGVSQLRNRSREE